LDGSLRTLNNIRAVASNLAHHEIAQAGMAVAADNAALAAASTPPRVVVPSSIRLGRSISKPCSDVGGPAVVVTEGTIEA
jgi:hypothetical protein